MAEFGAHLTSTETGDRPSIFELLAQENLMTSLQPALRYAVQVLSQKNPARYGRLHRYSEEIYAVLGLVLEHHYLRKFSKISKDLNIKSLILLHHYDIYDI